MITVELTTYGQSVASNRVTIEGIVLLSDQISDISSVTNTPSSTLLDIEACGSVTTNNIGNVIISDSSSSTWSAKTILFYVTVNNVKKVVAGYSQSTPIIKKSATSLNVTAPFNFSALTHGFCFSVIKSCSTVATPDSDGVLHIDNPDISADDSYAVYSKSQVDELLQGVSTSLSSCNDCYSKSETDALFGVKNPYVVCDTAAAVVKKEVLIPNFTIEAGAKIHIKFTNSNSISTPTLCIHNTSGDTGITYPIRLYGLTVPSNHDYRKWLANSIIELVFDGSYWYWSGFQYYTYESTYARYINTSGGYSVAQASYTSSSGRALLPYVDSDTEHTNLGSSSYRWHDLYLSNAINDGTNTFTLPSSSGTLALTSDIIIPTNHVTTDTNQTITGEKTFSSNNNYVKLSDGKLTICKTGNIDGASVTFSTELNQSSSALCISSSITPAVSTTDIYPAVSIGVTNTQYNAEFSSRKLTLNGTSSSRYVVKPNTNNSADLGTSNNYFYNGYITDLHAVNAYATRLYGAPVIAYAECTTSASTPQKSLSNTSNFPSSLSTGDIICIKFTNTNTAASPYFTVNGANYNLYKTTSTAVGTTIPNSWPANSLTLFRISGTSAIMVNTNSYPTSTASSTTNIIPSDNNAYDIGSSASKWRNAYFTGGNTNSRYVTIDNSGGEPTIRPDATNYGYLGTASYKWYRGYISNLYCTNLSNSASAIASVLKGDATGDTGIGSIRRVRIYLENSVNETDLFVKSGTTLSGYIVNRVYSRTDPGNDTLSFIHQSETYSGAWSLLEDVHMDAYESDYVVALAIRTA